MTNSSPTAFEFLRHCRPVYRESSLQTALEALREGGMGVVAVVDGPFLVGILTSTRLEFALLDGVSPLNAVSEIMSPNPVPLLPSSSVEVAMSRFRESGESVLPVVDADGRYVGMLSALSLFGRYHTPPSPGVVGGMATPFGVFLTNGEVSGGAGKGALVATGMMLSLMFLVGTALSVLAIFVIGNRLDQPVLTWLTHGGGNQWVDRVIEYGPPVFFLLLVRLIPLSGTHAAEHMVVHAIERHEPLTYDVVKRMPRVHPRCGTNLAVGALLFMFLLRVSVMTLGDVGALFGLLGTMLLWRQVGAFAQYFFTTKRPNRAQVEGAIRSAEELLLKYRSSTRVSPSFSRKLWNSGLPYVLLGATSVSVLFLFLADWLGLPPGLL